MQKVGLVRMRGICDIYGICCAPCMPGKTDTSVHTALCLGDIPIIIRYLEALQFVQRSMPFSEDAQLNL